MIQKITPVNGQFTLSLDLDSGTPPLFFASFLVPSSTYKLFKSNILHSSSFFSNLTNMQFSRSQLSLDSERGATLLLLRPPPFPLRLVTTLRAILLALKLSTSRIKPVFGKYPFIYLSCTSTFSKHLTSSRPLFVNHIIPCLLTSLSPLFSTPFPIFLIFIYLNYFVFDLVNIYKGSSSLVMRQQVVQSPIRWCTESDRPISLIGKYPLYSPPPFYTSLLLEDSLT